MDELLSLIRHHELAESLQPFGLLVEPDAQGGLCVNAGRLDAGVEDLLKAQGLLSVSAATLESDEAVAQFIAEIDALIAASPSRFVLRQASAAAAPLDMPRSAEWLKRYYGKKGFSPFGERKPSVVDHARSGGPFISSIDDEPLVFFDASSQIATHAGGLNAPQVQRSRDEGGFDADLVVNRDSSREDCPALNALAELMLEHVHPSLNHVAFANSGAEANEKALNLARQNGRGGHRLLAMKGSFHGRTLLPLHGTWNPVKRGPFEFAGFEAKWVDFPRHLLPDEEPQMPAGWVEAWRQGLGWQDTGDDALLTVELETLKSVDAQLHAEPIFAVITEVMQGEGGDNYATRRFFCALLALCRRHNTPLVIDEVQTGFGLGGPMFWHTSLRFEDSKGAADAPDLIASAKKAQLGAVLSRFADGEPTEVSSASAVRGLAQARIALATDHAAMAALGERSLKALAAALPEGLVTNVRGKGLAWGIDLPSGAVVNRLLAERFWRGYLTYIAGAHTLRFRLNPSMKDADWQAVVDALEDNLKGLVEQLGWQGPQAFAEAVAGLDKSVWQASGSQRKPGYGLAQGYRLEAMTLEGLKAEMPRVLELEAEVYEPQRRETAEGLCAFLELPGFIGHLAFSATGELAGFALGAALEGFENVDGCRADATWGSGQTLYSLEMLVSAEHRGQGIGRMLKSAQFDGARSAGFRFICGRNRVGGTHEMAPLNASLGAYTVARLGAQYGEPDGETDYYRLSLYPGRVDAKAGVDEGIDLAGGLQRPMGNKPESLLAAARRGAFGGPLCNKLSLCNFTTPDSIRFAELLQALAPQGCDHALYTSGRSEMVDKALRAIKYANKQADVVLSFEGCYVGHTTAAARSVSDHPLPYFSWPKLPHPARVGCGAALDALDEALDELGDRLLCLVIEPIGERSGLIIPSEFYAALQERREVKGLRVSVCETATGAFRNGYGSCFYVDSTELRADQVWWYAGGQLGVVFCADTTWVEKPLQLISTWDGDELCMIRSAHHLRFALRNQNAISQRAALMSRMLSRIGGASALGLCGHIPVEEAAEAESALAKLGVQVRSSQAGLTLLPPLSISADELGRGINAIAAL
jgi:acetylornithine/succinyldiaminopimelate/putrescine aminotransferase/GNAT superfamily N-acetyltransferase